MSRFLIILFLSILLRSASAQEPNDLQNTKFSGTYTNTGSQPLFNFFDVATGNFDIYFLRDDDDKSSEQRVGVAVLEFLNPKYHDQKAVDIEINLENYDKQNHQWIGESKGVEVYTYFKESKKSQTTCSASYSISFEGVQDNWNPKAGTVVIQLRGEGDGHCQFELTATGGYVEEKFKILGYCGFISAIFLVQIGCAFKLMNQLTSNQINAGKLSLLTISIITIQDFYLTMTHLYFLMTESRFYQYFILPIFLLVFMSIIFDMRLLFTVWRFKYINEIANGELRKKITVFYIQFYLGMFSYLMLMFLFTYDIWPLYIQAFIFVPQIVHNVRKGNNPHFYWYYILGILGMRVILPVYYRGCPENIYMIQPDPTFCIVWSTLFAIQILFLLAQKLCGPRFFIPKKFIPGHFDYYKKMELKPGMENPECSICLQTIFQDIKQGINESIQSDLIIKKKKVTVMRAPCNHMFHPECLIHWIDVKLECPTCRAELPAVQ